jgi:CHAD domain-containing protein
MDDTLNSYYLFGLETLQERLPAVSQEVSGVRSAEDIECVHRMRVASRRLRNALELFGDDLPRKSYDTWRVEMRRITKALGTARDTDVQIAWVEKFQEHVADESHRAGLERLLLRLRQKRARVQQEVCKALDRLEDKRILEEVYDALHELLVHARVYEVETLPADLYRRANEAIRLRLEEFLAYEPHVAYPDRTAELHQMRIAAKHLRYTLEVFDPIYEKGLRKPLKVVKEIQELLGEVHDCDVWIEFVPVFIEEEHERTLEYCGEAAPAQAFWPGLHMLEENRREQRMRSYYIFHHFWELTKEKNIWERLRQALAPQAEKLLTDVESTAMTESATS